MITNADELNRVRRDYDVGLREAWRILEHVHKGVCTDLDEAARYEHNRALAIYIAPQPGETAKQAHDRWALARAKEHRP